MRSYKELWYQSSDGLTLFARDYPAKGEAALTLLCMHGLTRNSVDFEPLIEHLSLDYRIISVDQRGRGLSARDPDPMNYQVEVYCNDMFTLINHLALVNPVLIGTSMGGLMSIAMQALQPGLFPGIVLNDIGPELDPTGLDRIKNYVGEEHPVRNWTDAVERLRSTSVYAFPDYGEDEWLALTQRLYIENESGIPVLNYDPGISIPLQSGDGEAANIDLWDLFALSKDLPMLLVRGELSDLLSVDCVEKMKQVNPVMDLVAVPRIGHAPVLDETPAREAIIGFLASLEDR